MYSQWPVQRKVMLVFLSFVQPQCLNNPHILRKMHKSNSIVIGVDRKKIFLSHIKRKNVISLIRRFWWRGGG